MYSKVVLVICAVCAVSCMSNALPADLLPSKSGKIYQVPLYIHSDKAFYNLQRMRRDVFPDYGQAQEGANKHVETSHEVILKSAFFKGDQNEELKSAADTIYPVIYRVRREYGSRRRYDDSDSSYEDSDSAGYDRKGSDVGYMDDNDDFPTVVW